MPVSSTRRRASAATFWRSISFSASSASSNRRASAIVTFWRRLRANSPGIISLRLMPTSSTPCGPIISSDGALDSSVSTSTSRSSSAPARSFSRSFSRVAERSSAPWVEAGPKPAAVGTSRASRRSSARAAAVAATPARISSRTSATPISVRSRTIDSQSRPT